MVDAGIARTRGPDHALTQHACDLLYALCSTKVSAGGRDLARCLQYLRHLVANDIPDKARQLSDNGHVRTWCSCPPAAGCGSGRTAASAPARRSPWLLLRGLFGLAFQMRKRSFSAVIFIWPNHFMLYAHRFFVDLMERQHEYTTQAAETGARQQNTRSVAVTFRSV